MDKVDKPAIFKVRFLVKCILVPVLLLCSLTTAWSTIVLAMRYRLACEDALTLQADITHVETIYDSEGDVYDAMMRYSCNGRTYTDAYRRFSREADAKAFVGSSVTIQVDPRSPDDTLEEIHESVNGGLLFAAILMALAMLVLVKITHRATYVQTYGWRREAVRRDMFRRILKESTCSWLLPAMTLYFAVAICFQDACLNWSIRNVILGLAAAGSLASLVKCIVRLRKLSRDQFYTRRDSFVSKRIYTESDDCDTHYVTYRNSNGVWEKQVKPKVYHAAREGEQIDSAYLEGETTPVLSFSGTRDLF